MMHPIDIETQREQERTPGGGSVWWAVIVLLLVFGLVVAAAIAFSGDGQRTPDQPVPNEAPVDSGDTGT